jgi:lysophospholipase L1-like esterase
MAGATGLELLFKVRRYWPSRDDFPDPTPRAHRLNRAYTPFGILHLHPQYFYFFPLDPRERMALSNETCSIDADGFRGPGPAYAGGRRLAFLLGGSAAFGDQASSDATTITGYLNRSQDEYFFVNAGVPTWTSSQEMFRLAFQILDYHPALVITYDGYNDASVVDYFGRQRSDFNAGLPQDFEALAELVEAQRSAPGKRAAALVSGYLFPELKERIVRRWRRVARSGAAPVESATLPESVVRAGAATYLSAQARMHDLTKARGARFIAVFQPVAELHRHLGPGFQHESRDSFEAIDRFHRAVLAQYAHDFEFHDLVDVFDQHYASIPVPNPDVTDATIFVDEVHLNDPGNEIVARELSTIIR